MQEEQNKPAKKGDIEDAFNALAAFLFELYKRKKQADLASLQIDASID